MSPGNEPIEDAFRNLVQSGAVDAFCQQVNPQAALPEEAAPGTPVREDTRSAVDALAPQIPSPAGRVLRAYQELIQRLQQLQVRPPSLLLTSAEAGSGKTATALNLARLIGLAADNRVLLVDMNLARPALPMLLDLPPAEADLRAALEGDCDLEDALHYGRAENLYVLCARRAWPGGPEVLRRLDPGAWTDRLHTGFDFVIIDTPALPLSPEAALLGRFVGGVALVERQGAAGNARETVCGRLREARAEVLGVIRTFA